MFTHIIAGAETENNENCTLSGARAYRVSCQWCMCAIISACGGAFQQYHFPHEPGKIVESLLRTQRAL